MLLIFNSFIISYHLFFYFEVSSQILHLDASQHAPWSRWKLCRLSLHEITVSSMLFSRLEKMNAQMIPNNLDQILALIFAIFLFDNF